MIVRGVAECRSHPEAFGRDLGFESLENAVQPRALWSGNDGQSFAAVIRRGLVAEL
jgi:hypothetical protein